MAEGAVEGNEGKVTRQSESGVRAFNPAANMWKMPENVPNGVFLLKLPVLTTVIGDVLAWWVGIISRAVLAAFSNQRSRRTTSPTADTRRSQRRDAMAETSRQKATVFVGGLDPAVSKETLFHAFLPFGEIVDVTLPKPELPSSKDPHRGYGYVEFEHADDAKEAIDNMDRSEMYGQVIKVAVAKPQKDHTEGLGSKTAIWEQVSSMNLYSEDVYADKRLGGLASEACCE
jgi:hypothetical protein